MTSSNGGALGGDLPRRAVRRTLAVFELP